MQRMFSSSISPDSDGIMQSRTKKGETDGCIPVTQAKTKKGKKKNWMKFIYFILNARGWDHRENKYTTNFIVPTLTVARTNSVNCEISVFLISRHIRTTLVHKWNLMKCQSIRGLLNNNITRVRRITRWWINSVFLSVGNNNERPCVRQH